MKWHSILSEWKQHEVTIGRRVSQSNRTRSPIQSIHSSSSLNTH
jgi:hypothetical protein